jgi:hypothetical protein
MPGKNRVQGSGRGAERCPGVPADVIEDLTERHLQLKPAAKPIDQPSGESRTGEGDFPTMLGDGFED